MKITKILLLLILTSIAFSCKKKEDPAPQQVIPQPVSNSTETLKQGTFIGYAHDLSGNAFIIKDGGKQILRLVDYNMTSGPDVDLLLSKSASYSASSVVKISDLDGSYTNSAINFEIPTSVNWEEYPYVMVWCVQANVNFGTTQLLNP